MNWINHLREFDRRYKRLLSGKGEHLGDDGLRLRFQLRRGEARNIIDEVSMGEQRYMARKFPSVWPDVLRFAESPRKE